MASSSGAPGGESPGDIGPKGGAPGKLIPAGLEHRRTVVTVDGEALAELYTRLEEVQKITEDLAASLRNQGRLLRINAQLEEEAATLRGRLLVLTAELNLQRGGDPAAPAGGKRPRQ